jgi:uncharacterized protein (TIGR03118 family)
MRIRSAAAASLALALTVGVASTASAQFYSQHNLVSDTASGIPAVNHDDDLVNAWGLVASATSPWWVSDNQTGVSTLYNAAGVKITGISPTGHVAIPGGFPTGVVFNGTTAFHIPADGTARFIFASEAGIISAWAGGPSAVSVVDNSPSGAVYKGLAIAQTNSGSFLYASNFHAGTVDVFNGSFAPVVNPNAFRDPTLPPGYAPFGIQTIGDVIYVTYALQDAAAHDDVSGPGHGFVNAFDTAGTLLMRVASGDELNSPWGVAMAPTADVADFGKFTGDLLIGNFGDGRIHAFIPPATPGAPFVSHGPLHSTHGRPIEIDGLWALQFGHGAPNNGPKNALFFTAGPFDEAHGLFGRLDVAGPPGHDR